MGRSLIIHVFDGKILVSKYGQEGKLTEEFEVDNTHLVVSDARHVCVNRYVFTEGVMIVIDIGEE